jgi:hypothetical protein
MLQLTVEQRSVDSVVDYVERVKMRIFAQMRVGMREAMEGLAAEAVSQASTAGIQMRTGQLFEDILNSPSVHETAELIVGGIGVKSDMTIKGRTFQGYLGTALDEGYTVPSAVPLSRKIDKAQGTAGVFQFIAANGDTRFTFGHKAIRVRPHPFLRQAKEAFTDPIMEIIAARVAEAYEE